MTRCQVAMAMTPSTPAVVMILSMADPARMKFLLITAMIPSLPVQVTILSMAIMATTSSWAMPVMTACWVRMVMTPSMAAPGLMKSAAGLVRIRLMAGPATTA